MATRRTSRPWTSEEDELLKQAVAESTQNNVISWHNVASHIPGRNNKDCRKRWVYALASSIQKGPWDEDEDNLLMEGVQTHGFKWALVSQVVGSRQPDQCSRRWHEVLNPTINHDRWSLFEDETLRRAVQLHGRRWTEIVERYFPDRTPIAAKNRYTLRFGNQSSAESSSSENTRSSERDTAVLKKGAMCLQSYDQPPANQESTVGVATRGPALEFNIPVCFATTLDAPGIIHDDESLSTPTASSRPNLCAPSYTHSSTYPRLQHDSSFPTLGSTDCSRVDSSNLTEMTFFAPSNTPRSISDPVTDRYTCSQQLESRSMTPPFATKNVDDFDLIAQQTANPPHHTSATSKIYLADEQYGYFN